MANRILEGLWDCPYCKTTAIGGLTKHCPCCGHPQDKGTRFYMGAEIKYLDSDLAEQYGQGPDWVCPYCGSLNRHHFQFCSNCGAPKEEAQKDYFTNDAPADDVAPEQNAPTGQELRAPVPKSVGKGPKIAFILIALAVALGLFFGLRPKNITTKVSDKQWARSIDVQALRMVEESDWAVPDGGTLIGTQQEVHHFTPVLDHYETRTREVAEQVYDGEDEHTSYSDNGDGTFSEHTYTTPRYRTEYHTETYQEPIYVQVPIYATKYYYNIDRWVPDRTEESGGGDDEPYWPEFELADNERTGYQYEKYRIIVTDEKKQRNYSVELSQPMWSEYHIGDGVTVTVSAGRVTKLDGKPVN